VCLLGHQHRRWNSGVIFNTGGNNVPPRPPSPPMTFWRDLLHRHWRQLVAFPDHTQCRWHSGITFNTGANIVPPWSTTPPTMFWHGLPRQHHWGNILYPHPYVAPMMFRHNFQHWGQQYVSSVIHIVDGIPITPMCIQVLQDFVLFFLHKSFCLLDDQCAFTNALLRHHIFSKKKGLHAS